MRVANVFMILLFAFSVAVQYNDPDPIRWMAIYGAAMIVSILAATGRGPRWEIAAAIGLVALGWGATIIPNAIRGHAPLRDVFYVARMKTLAVEETREMLGLFIVAGWMAAVAVWRRRATA